MKPRKQPRTLITATVAIVSSLVGTTAAVGVLTTATTFAYPSKARAIPAFARRYQTSCQTCHTTFPALTPFGEAFRRNGYRFPNREDDERSHDEPVELGQDVHKRLFPNETWPGELPGMLPVAATITPSMELARPEEGEGHGGGGLKPAVMVEEPNEEPFAVSFGGSELGVLLAGTFGQNLTYFAKVEVAPDGDVRLERPFVALYPFDEPVLSIRAGAFEPSLSSFSQHRSLVGHGFSFTRVTLGDNAWAPEPQQLGFEASGIVLRRFGYAVGVVEGSGHLASAKDVYGRLEVKLGGMSLDGIEPTGRSAPWQEIAVLIGASAYRGVGLIEDPAGGEVGQTDRFWRLGADVQTRVDDLSVTLGAFSQLHQRPIWGNPDSGALYGLMGEANYVVFPWLVPVVVYELYRQELPGMEGQSGQRLTLGVNALLRANIAIRAMALGRKDGSEKPRFQEVSLALSTAF